MDFVLYMCLRVCNQRERNDWTTLLSLIDMVFIHAELSPSNRSASIQRHHSWMNLLVGDVGVLQGCTGIARLDGRLILILINLIDLCYEIYLGYLCDEIAWTWLVLNKKLRIDLILFGGCLNFEVNGNQLSGNWRDKTLSVNLYEEIFFPRPTHCPFLVALAAISHRRSGRVAPSSSPSLLLERPIKISASSKKLV